MGTSQAALARIEGARENITLRTLGRTIEALKGRLTFFITPAELNIPAMPPWHSLVGVAAAEPYTCRFVGMQIGAPMRVGIGWESSAHSVLDGVTITGKSVRLGPGEEKAGEVIGTAQGQAVV
jgi:hypothetical protein